MNLRMCIGIAVALIFTPCSFASQPAWSPDAAAKYLDARAKWWTEWPNAARGQGTACISCHTTFPYALARPALGTMLGEIVPGAVEMQLIDNVKKRVANFDKIVGEPGKEKDPFRPFYGNQRKPSALGTEAVLNALVLVNYDVRRAKGVLSEPTKKALAHLWTTQQADGTWQWLDFGLRPWETDGVFLGASLAGLAVGMAGKDYREQADVKPKLELLTKYLTTETPKQRLHDRMFALWAASKLPGVLDEKEKNAIVTTLVQQQEPDGGWTSPKLGITNGKKNTWTSQGVTATGAVSDGYATGLAVLALKSIGNAPDESVDATRKKGIGWLIANQTNGIWPATYLNKKRDPESEIGQFMRDAATAFAVLALGDN
jgi:squalene-hopene/tetraprenyl-beta-curcumene cyclase